MENRTGEDLLLTHSLMLGERLYLFARLRFLAAAGILVAGPFATYVVGIPGLDLWALAGLALFLAGVNVAAYVMVRPHRRAPPDKPDQRRLVWIAHSSILLDYLVLTAAIWLVGGAASPFRAFYLLHAILAAVLRGRPELRDKLPALVNDCLLALSARSLGATLYTRNRDDFTLLQSRRAFSLVVIS